MPTEKKRKEQKIYIQPHQNCTQNRTVQLPHPTEQPSKHLPTRVSALSKVIRRLHLISCHQRLLPRYIIQMSLNLLCIVLILLMSTNLPLDLLATERVCEEWV